MLVYFSVSLLFTFLVQEQARASHTDTRCYPQHSAIVMSQGRLNLASGTQPGPNTLSRLRVRLFTCYSSIPFLYNTRPNPLVRRVEGFDSRGTSHRPPGPLQIIQPKSVSRCTSWNKPSIQPSNPTCQAALFSTSRITTTTENTQRRVCPNSLEIS